LANPSGMSHRATTAPVRHWGVSGSTPTETRDDGSSFAGGLAPAPEDREEPGLIQPTSTHHRLGDPGNRCNTRRPAQSIASSRS